MPCCPGSAPGSSHKRCELRQMTGPLCISVFLLVNWGNNGANLTRVLLNSIIMCGGLWLTAFETAIVPSPADHFSSGVFQFLRILIRPLGLSLSNQTLGTRVGNASCQA